MDLKQKQINLNSTDNLNEVFFLAFEYAIKTIRQVNRVIYCNAFFNVIQLQIQVTITLISSVNYPHNKMEGWYNC